MLLMHSLPEITKNKVSVSLVDALSLALTPCETGEGYEASGPKPALTTGLF